MMDDGRSLIIVSGRQESYETVNSQRFHDSQSFPLLRLVMAGKEKERLTAASIMKEFLAVSHNCETRISLEAVIHH